MSNNEKASHFSNIFMISYRKYNKLPEDNKKIIKSYVITLLFLFVINLLVHVASDGFLIPLIKVRAKFLEPIFSMVSNFSAVTIETILATMVAIIFAIFDHINVLSPLEEDIQNSVSKLQGAIKDLDTNISTMSESLNKQDKIQSDILTQTMKKFQSYDKYSIARTTFGFNSIVGMVGRKPHPCQMHTLSKKILP